jgi:hypothetical protein
MYSLRPPLCGNSFSALCSRFGALCVNLQVDFAMIVQTIARFIPLLHLVASLEISDPIFDQSWMGKVRFVDRLNPSELWRAFFVDSQPIKTTLPALSAVRERWTNEYLASKFGHVRLQTENARENRTTDYCGMERLGSTITCGESDYAYLRQIKVMDTLGEYLSKLSSPSFDRYVITMLDEDMSRELPFLPAFACGLYRAMAPIDRPSDSMHATEIHELNFWFSRGSTVSTLHYDMNHQIMCQIEGRKDWRFWDLRTELQHIPMWSGFYPKSYQSDDSPIDPLDVDLEKFPNFLRAKWFNTTLNPGECLLIPNQHWLHLVQSTPSERNMGFSVHVSAPADGSHSLYDCDESASSIDSTELGKFHVTWPFPGDPRESTYNKVRMGMPLWKDLAIHALQELARNQTPLAVSISEMTEGRSEKSPRIMALLREAGEYVEKSDLVGLFEFGPLWREVATLRYY